MTALTLFGLFFLFLILNIPIAVSLALSSIITLFVTSGFESLSIVPDVMIASNESYTLLAIPFFIFAGVIMEYGGISKRLINLADNLVGHWRAGMGMVTVITAVFFAAISGSGPATVAAIGTILIPAMLKKGYPKNTASALLAGSGSIGIVIPPSIAFIVFAVVAGDLVPVSIGRLFIAGVVPGLLMAIAFIVSTIIILPKKSTKEQEESSKEKVNFKELLKSFLDAIWGLLVPVIILGGIYSGIFTPTESAAVAVFYGLFVGLFIYKDLKIKHFGKLLLDTSIQVAVIMLIVVSASIFAHIVISEQIAGDMADFLISFSDNKVIMLLIINIILLIAGAFVDANSAFYIFVPILLPVALELGVDPTAFGVIMTLNLAIGLFTPPVGINLFVASGIAKTSLKEISKGAFPYIVSSIIVLLLITFIPEIITWLPDLIEIE